LYVKRWLKAPIQMADGKVVERDRGTPRFARPDEYASFEFSAHGAMVFFAWFHDFRRL
jgi:hypothetical protein